MAVPPLRIALTVLLAIAAPLTAQQPAPAPYAAALALEAEDSLEAASALLREHVAALDTVQKKHLAKLDSLLHGQGVAETYASRGHFALALAALRRPALDTLRDVHLVLRRNARIADIQQRVLARADSAAARTLKRADSLRERERFAEALILYQAVAGAEGRYSPELVERARESRAQAEHEKEEAGPGFLQTLGAEIITALTTLSGHLFYLLLAIAAAGLLYYLRRYIPSRPGVALEVEDLTAGADLRDRANHLLAREICREIRSLGSLDDLSPVDRFEDLDGVQVANIRSARFVFDKVESFIADETPVRLGILSFSPRQLLSLLRSLASRPYESTLKGYLATAGDGGCVLYMERLDRKSGNGAAPPYWTATHTGENSRGEVIRQVLAHYVFDHAEVRPTDRWESFWEYQLGVDSLGEERDATAPQDRLEEARRHLDGAVRLDPSNWMAWFKLAEVLRKLGQNEDALRYFDYVEQLLRQQGGACRAGAEFLQRHPDFPLVVRYNRAVTLSKSPDSRVGLGALEIFDSLSGDIEALAAVGEAQLAERCARLRMLVRSAKGAALALKLESLRERRMSNARNNEEFKQALADIKEIRNWFLERPIEEITADLQTYQLALAVAYNASGNAAYLTGGYFLALREFEAAVNRAPRMADPYIGLAAAYMGLREKADPRWQEQMQEALDRALELSPSNGKAHYYRGKLHLEMEEYEKAKEDFRRADPHPWTLFLLAGILADQDGDLPGAVRILRQSIRIQRRPDHRYVKLLVTMLALARRTSPNGKLLVQARPYAEKLAKQGVTPGLKIRGQELLQNIEDLARAAPPVAPRVDPGALAPPVQGGA